MGLNDRTGTGAGSESYQRRGALRPLRDKQLGPTKASSIVGRDTSFLGSVVAEIVATGRGVLLSATSDGGAVSLTLYEGERRWREYSADPDDFVALLEAVRGHVGAPPAGDHGRR